MSLIAAEEREAKLKEENEQLRLVNRVSRLDAWTTCACYHIVAG